MTQLSLRSRLLLLILLPLVVIATILAVIRFRDAERTSWELFDRTLLAATFAIARDVAAASGDTLELSQWDILNDASGGQVFYHVGGPDGTFVVGYATPPVPPVGVSWEGEEPLFYNATHLGIPVRAVRLRALVTSGAVTGYSIVTAWQRLDAREAFARDLALRTLFVLAALLASVAAFIWLGVQRGVKPLLDLEEAISRRSGDDLQPIRRPVPIEISGLVTRLNRLFEQVRGEMQSKDAFISDAAHQLRNPVAGLLAMAEALEAAPDGKAAAERAGDLVAAARLTSRLTTQLLSYDRAARMGRDVRTDRVDLALVAEEAAQRLPGAVPVLSRNLSAGVTVLGDAGLLGEAIYNLLDNAAVHGDGGEIKLSVRRIGDCATVTVSNSGPPLAPEDLSRATERFAQLTETAEQAGGSGLGLAIVKAIADRHGGTLSARPSAIGAVIDLTLPAV